jgi:hypothetical protein
MHEAFDPYHKWLGIPPEDQPPNCYRLLAINLFESDSDVIDAAADQRMVHLRTFQGGENSALCQRILNEVSAARICLLSADKKAEYDQDLRRQGDATGNPPTRRTGPVGRPAVPAVPPRPAGSAGGFDVSLAPGLEAVPGRLRASRRAPPWRIAAGVVVVCVGLAAILLAGRYSDVPLPDDRPPLPVDNSSVPVRQPAVPDEEPLIADHGPALPTDELPVSDDGPPVPDDGPSVADDGPPVPDDQPPMPDRKLPVPDSDALKEAEERLKAILASQPAARLVEIACSGDHDHVERYALLAKACHAAAVVGDAETALRAVDETAGRYEIDVLELKADALVGLIEGAKDAAAFGAVAEHGLALIDQAVGSGKRDLAQRVAPVALAAARKAGNRELIKKATLRLVELQQQP